MRGLGYVTPQQQQHYISLSESEHILPSLLSVPKVEANESRVPLCSALPLYSQQSASEPTELLQSVNEELWQTK